MQRKGEITVCKVMYIYVVFFFKSYMLHVYGIHCHVEIKRTDLGLKWLRDLILDSYLTLWASVSSFIKVGGSPYCFDLRWKWSQLMCVKYLTKAHLVKHDLFLAFQGVEQLYFSCQWDSRKFLHYYRDIYYVYINTSNIVSYFSDFEGSF